MLEEFLETNAALFADDYLVLKIDTAEMENGETVGDQLRGDRDGGIPWIVILAGDGSELISSDGPNGNVGCPITSDERAWFVSMIEQTTQHAPAGRVADIGAALDSFARSKYPKLAD